MSELLRQRDRDDYTFVSCLSPDGRVQVLIRPHPVLLNGRENTAPSHVYRFTPREARALIAVLDIAPAAPE